MEEWQLQELAYTVFAGCGGRASSPDLLQYVRLQLEVCILAIVIQSFNGESLCTAQHAVTLHLDLGGVFST